MKKKVGIVDVAAKAGLSCATVSRYINKTAFVSDKNSKLIQDAIDSLEYIPNTAARILANKRMMTLGLACSALSDPYFSSLIRGIEKRSRQLGYALLIHSIEEVEEVEEVKKKPNFVFGEHNTDGVIVFADSLNDEDLKRLTDSNFPVVLIFRSSPPFMDIPFINIENKEGAYRLVSHLIKAHQYKRIVFQRGPATHENGQWREAGYRKALRENGIYFDPELIEYGGFNHEMARKSIFRLLEKKVQFDAVFSGDDDAASGSISALLESGYKVPEDIAVVGFDDQIIASYVYPSLTTVGSHIEEVCFKAVDKLVDIINGKPVEIETFVPTELIIRNSCGCE
ncbi:LacI family transcriptional regulator [Oceanispirochaeta crateris]|uniref:LacI family transcriptional regulator n=1 Tax=Oceanispirochaeta crateris TaxID=2518645 RepID=A0A5C1QN97_9SPIO|nr:LacI family DNA-binding transcriptional regulator [Oceanispirochaeta crateris]QEN08046.1 LacI family transcriptional regulator [Oceanispirochaeta crateris]